MSVVHIICVQCGMLVFKSIYYTCIVGGILYSTYVGGETTCTTTTTSLPVTPSPVLSFSLLPLSTSSTLLAAIPTQGHSQGGQRGNLPPLFSGWAPPN